MVGAAACHMSLRWASGPAEGYSPGRRPRLFMAAFTYSGISVISDSDNTVIMVQIENEIGMLEDARDHSPLAEAGAASAAVHGGVHIQRHFRHFTGCQSKRLDIECIVPCHEILIGVAVVAEHLRP